MTVLGCLGEDPMKKGPLEYRPEDEVRNSRLDVG